MNCKKCSDSIEDFDGIWDGYCIDCWPGYDDCANPVCNHFRIEHAFPDTEWTTVYSKNHPEEVGERFKPEVGCMNAGCPCKEFQEPNESKL